MVIRFAFHLYPVGLGQLVPRMADTVLQGAIIGEQNQALTVTIKPACGVNPFHFDKTRQGQTIFSISELTQDIKRLI